MVLYPYSFQAAFDPNIGEAAPRDSVGQVFAVGDRSFAQPLPTVDLNGMPVTLTVGEHGYLPDFMVEDHTAVVWRSGPYVFQFATTIPVKGDEGDAGKSAYQSAVDSGFEGSEAEWLETLKGSNVIPTDEAIAGNLATEGTETRRAADARINELVAPVVVPDSTKAYRRRPIHNLPFKHADWDAAVAKWGHLYPQGFTVDEAADEMFIVSFAADTGTWMGITVYKWSTGEYKCVFAINTTVVSESVEIRYEGGKRYLYLRTSYNRLDKYDVTTLPGTLSVAGSAGSVAIANVSTKFTATNDRWTIQSATPPIANVSSNGIYTVFDAAFSPLRQLVLSDHLTGPTLGTGDALLPKTQGICEGDGVYAFSIGANYGKGSPVSQKHYFGVRVISGNGHLLVDALADPAKALAKLDALGYATRALEAEGMVYRSGKYYSLLLINSWSATTADGILVMEEFSSHPDAIDFSDCAVTAPGAEARTLQTGLHPRGHDGKLHNPNDYSVLDSVDKILTYMESVNQSVFSFYSTNVAITGLDGAAIPSGYLVRLFNCNNNTHMMNVTGAGSDWYRISGAAGSRTQAATVTGWNPINLNTATFRSHTFGKTPSYRVVNDTIELSGTVSRITGNMVDGDNIGNIPAGSRPSAGTFTTAAMGVAPYVCRVNISTAGDIVVNFSGTPGWIDLAGAVVRKS